MHCVISGFALATPQGGDAPSTWQNLLGGAVLHETGRVPLPIDSALPRVSQLAVHVARQAIAMAKWSAGMIGDDRTALIIGTSKGPIEAWLAGRPTSAFGVAAVAADVAAAISHGAGPRSTSSAACASGLHALIHAKALINGGRCDRALVVAAESSTSALFQATFQRLGVIARPDIGCKPFDIHREGFLLAEAAAAVCIERSTDQGVAIEATNLVADAAHMTGLDPTGRSLAAALHAVAGDRPIDLVHAHGTGTEMNDRVEFAAIAATCPGASIFSHKHAIGHTQGASGLIAVVLNVLSHRNGIVLPNANSPQPLSGAALALSRPSSRPVLNSIAIAAGFGGPVATVRLTTR